MRVVLAGVLLGLVLCRPATAGVLDPAHPIRFPAITALASKVAGQPVDAFCEDAKDWSADTLRPPRNDAYAWRYPDGRSGVVFSADVCGGLVLFLADPSGRRVPGYLDRRAYGLFALAHEANHLIGSGDWDEGAVECRAIRSVRAIAISLGADPKYADSLYAIAFAIHLEKPPAYRTVC